MLELPRQPVNAYEYRFNVLSSPRFRRQLTLLLAMLTVPASCGGFEGGRNCLRRRKLRFASAIHRVGSPSAL